MNIQTNRKGRPTLSHDNQNVYAFLGHYDFFSDLKDDFPEVESILTGISWLQSEGQASTRPLSRRELFQVLRQCPVITTERVKWVLKDLSQPQVNRYFMASRVASNALRDLLERSPKMMEYTSSLKTSREALDATYLEELEGLSKSIFSPD